MFICRDFSVLLVGYRKTQSVGRCLFAGISASCWWVTVRHRVLVGVYLPGFFIVLLVGYRKTQSVGRCLFAGIFYRPIVGSQTNTHAQHGYKSVSPTDPATEAWVGWCLFCWDFTVGHRHMYGMGTVTRHKHMYGYGMGTVSDCLSLGHKTQTHVRLWHGYSQ